MNFVRLDSGQQMVARMIAEQRRMMDRSAGVRDAKIGKQDADYTDLNGIGGEIAFAILANVCPDLSIRPRAGGYDCRTARNTVDVKTSKYDDAQLVAHVGKSATAADVYVLVVGEMPVYRIVGWAWAHELLRKENIVNLGYGDTYALPQSALHPWGERQVERTEAVTTSVQNRTPAPSASERAFAHMD